MLAGLNDFFHARWQSHNEDIYGAAIRSHVGHHITFRHAGLLHRSTFIHSQSRDTRLTLVSQGPPIHQLRSSAVQDVCRQRHALRRSGPKRLSARLLFFRKYASQPLAELPRPRGFGLGYGVPGSRRRERRAIAIGRIQDHHVPRPPSLYSSRPQLQMYHEAYVRHW